MATVAKPFVKWAGGKTQLLNQIDGVIPPHLKQDGFTYIEPFVGGGAVLFHILNSYSNVEKVVINDINKELINTYKTIRDNVTELIEVLTEWQTEYHYLSDDEEKKKAYYYDKRKLFNSADLEQATQSALFIFLNRTCFNGLYRVNRKNEFNVPIGSYKKPMICDTDNLLSVSKLLKKVVIMNQDFEKTLSKANKNSFFYFDPPYKPLSTTSNFTSYASSEFDDNEQVRLAKFCEKLDKLGHNWALSNSDLETNSGDNFFTELFKDYKINKVLASRNINSNAQKRGQLSELLITNHKQEYAEVI